jgi:hypothetical protein
LVTFLRSANFGNGVFESETREIFFNFGIFWILGVACLVAFLRSARGEVQSAADALVGGRMGEQGFYFRGIGTATASDDLTGAGHRVWNALRSGGALPSPAAARRPLPQGSGEIGLRHEVQGIFWKRISTPLAAAGSTKIVYRSGTQ